MVLASSQKLPNTHAWCPKNSPTTPPLSRTLPPVEFLWISGGVLLRPTPTLRVFCLLLLVSVNLVADVVRLGGPGSRENLVLAQEHLVQFVYGRVQGVVENASLHVPESKWQQRLLNCSLGLYTSEDLKFTAIEDFSRLFEKIIWDNFNDVCSFIFNNSHKTSTISII